MTTHGFPAGWPGLRRRVEPDRRHAAGLREPGERESGDDSGNENEQLGHAASFRLVTVAGAGVRRRQTSVIAVASASAERGRNPERQVRERAARRADLHRLERVRLSTAVGDEAVVHLVRERAGAREPDDSVIDAGLAGRRCREGS